MLKSGVTKYEIGGRDTPPPSKHTGGSAMNDSVSDAILRATRTFMLRNGRSANLTLVLEPWANEYEIAPNNSIRIVEEGDESGMDLEIQLDDSHVVVFARAGTTLKAIRGGEELP
jgi:hypothetical protein